jgi:hypothetical protein
MMQAQNSDLPPKPPKAVNALLSGFNVTAGNLSVLLFPVAFDLFLWLGPRLKVHNLFLQTIQDLITLQRNALMPVPPMTPEEMAKPLTDFNLFSILRTYPFGVFSVMIGNRSDVSPLGARLDWEIPNFLVLISAFILLTCLGLLLGSLYFYSVARIAIKPSEGPGLLYGISHSLLLWSVWTALYFIMRPFVQFAALLLINNQFIILLILLLLAWPVTWAGLMIFFSTHGIFALSKNAFASFGQNFRLLRYGMPPMGWFALMAIIISQGMDIIWLTPAKDSWMALVGILGHAFISTALLAGSFIFYRDLNSWVDEALAWIKLHQVTSARA